eukprot:157564-Rhodomonas_salina.3
MPYAHLGTRASTPDRYVQRVSRHLSQYSLADMILCNRVCYHPTRALCEVRCLSACYAKSGTDLAYGATRNLNAQGYNGAAVSNTVVRTALCICYAVFSVVTGYASAGKCPVPTELVLLSVHYYPLRIPYTRSSTNLGYSATSATSCPVVSSDADVLVPEPSSTNLRHSGTRATLVTTCAEAACGCECCRLGACEVSSYVLPTKCPQSLVLTYAGIVLHASSETSSTDVPGCWVPCYAVPRQRPVLTVLILLEASYLTSYAPRSTEKGCPATSDSPSYTLCGTDLGYAATRLRRA